MKKLLENDVFWYVLTIFTCALISGTKGALFAVAYIILRELILIRKAIRHD